MLNQEADGMEESLTRCFGRLERILKAHECCICMHSNGACRDLAIVLWNIVALEIVTVMELDGLKRELLAGLCEVMSRKGALIATDGDHAETCYLIKAIAIRSTQNYFTECSRFVLDNQELKGAQQIYPSLIDEVTMKLDLFFASKFSKGLENFVEPMACPLACTLLERDSFLDELRTGILLFQYLVRHSGKSSCNYDRLLGRFIINFIPRENYKDPLFRLLYSDVVELVGIIAEFGKDMFNGKKLYTCRYLPG